MNTSPIFIDFSIKMIIFSIPPLLRHILETDTSILILGASKCVDDHLESAQIGLEQFLSVVRFG